MKKAKASSYKMQSDNNFDSIKGVIQKIPHTSHGRHWKSCN